MSFQFRVENGRVSTDVHMQGDDSIKVRAIVLPTCGDCVALTFEQHKSDKDPTYKSTSIFMSKADVLNLQRRLSETLGGILLSEMGGD